MYNNIKCSVCIATYKRPELLRKLLNSLVGQVLTDNIRLEIIVVDNDPDMAGKAILDTFSDSEKISFYYYTQPVKNISITRNKAVQSASGEYLFFIDDDEIASPNWINLLIETMKKYNADAVFGRVLSYFDESVPDWIRKSYIFNRPSPATGTRTIHTRTGNCLIKASVINKVSGPFDPAYGITGGEDTHLFNKLKNDGRIFINSYEAWVTEYQPVSRARPFYIIKRAFWTGNLYARRTIEFSKTSRILIRVNILLKSLLIILISFTFLIICLPNKHYRLHWASKISSKSGKILAVFGQHPKSYN